MRRLLAVAPAAGLGVAFMPSAAVADDDPPEVPVAIEVEATGTDDQSLREGDERTYAISVHNETERDFPEAVIVQMLPGGFHYDRAEPDATVHPNSSLSWARPLPGDGSVNLTVTATAGTREELEQAQMVRVAQPGSEAGVPESGDGRDFTTTVCVRESQQGRLLGCSSYAGTLVPAAPDRSLARAVIAAVGIALLAVTTKVLLARRRRPVQA